MHSDSDGSDTEKRVEIKPIWFENSHKTPEKILAWFKDTLPTLEKINRDRICTQVNNLAWFNGDWEAALNRGVVRKGKRDKPIPRRTIPFVVNHLYDLLEQRIARLSRFKPAVTILPANDEHRDRVSSQFAELILKQINRLNQFDTKLQETERWNAVYGEMYLDIEWNPKIGDKEKDEETEEEKRIGDVEYSLCPPMFKLLEPKRKYQDVRWCIEIHEIIHVEEAKRKYENKKIKEDDSQKIFDFETGLEIGSKRAKEVIIYRIIYKPDEFLPDGAFITLTKDQVLEKKKKYPYSHGDFPFERITDIDVPNELYGVSALKHIKPIQNNYNKMTSLLMRNLFLTAHPKILMPEGAAKIESMGNSATVISFKGPIPPKVVTFPASPAEAYGFKDSLRSEMEQIYGIHGVSRGEPPPGIRAGIALQFLEEQEQQRANANIVKHNDFIVRVNKKAIAIAGDYYKTGKDAGRLVRILGESNQFETDTLKEVQLSGPYDIVIQNSTALSESKAGRIQQVIDLATNLPGVFDEKQITDMLDLASPDKFYDVATAALRAAEAENEKMLRGSDVSPPEAFENHIEHWKSHLIEMQSRHYKENVPKKSKELFKDHVMGHERLMIKDALKNFELGQQIRTLTGFPVFYAPTPDELGFLQTGQVLPSEPQISQLNGEPVVDPLTGEPLETPGPLTPGELPAEAPAPEDLPPDLNQELQ